MIGPTLPAIRGTIDGELEAIVHYRRRYAWMGGTFTEWWALPTASALLILACESILEAAP